MEKSELLRVADVRDAFRLIGDCRDLGSDPGLWCPRLLEGLRRLIGAQAATGGEGIAPRPGRPVSPLSSFEAGLDAHGRRMLGAYMRDGGPASDPLIAGLEYLPGKTFTRTRREVVPDAEYYQSSVYRRYLRPGEVEHRLVSVHRVSDASPFSVIHLHRERSGRDFSGREQRLLHFLHEELGPLVGRALVSAAEPSPEALCRRLRQTLACLLEGDSEKQIAHRLGLSLPTVHQYVTALYRRFGVRSRAQLLAYAFKRAGRETWRHLGSSV